MVIPGFSRLALDYVAGQLEKFGTDEESCLICGCKTDLEFKAAIVNQIDDAAMLENRG